MTQNSVDFGNRRSGGLQRRFWIFVLLVSGCGRTVTERPPAPQILSPTIDEVRSLEPGSPPNVIAIDKNFTVRGSYAIAVEDPGYRPPQVVMQLHDSRNVICWSAFAAAVPEGDRQFRCEVESKTYPRTRPGKYVLKMWIEGKDVSEVAVEVR